VNKEFEIPAVRSWKRVFEPRLMYYLVFIGLAVLYMLTLATTITATGDSSEFVVSSYVLGVAHPPGYPLFTLVGHLFTYLPLFNMAYRINIFSMLFSMLSLIICFEILKKLIKNDLVAIICVVFLAITRLVWEYSIVAEVFALNNFFVLLLILIIIKWEETGSGKILYLFCFILGLSLTHHQTILFLTPAFALFIYQNRNKLKGFNYILAGFLFIAGLTPYGFLPYAASRMPPLNWDDPTTFEKFIHIIKRGDYPSPAVNFEHFFDWEYGQLYLYIASAFRNLTVAGFLLGLVGIFTGHSRMKKHYWLFLIAFIFTSIIFVSLIGYNRDPVVLHVIQRLYIYSFLIFIVFIALGIIWLNEKFNKINNLVSYICITLVLLLLVNNYSNVDKSNNHLLYNFTGNMLKSYPPGSIMIVSGDTLSMGIDYHQMVEKHRRDVIVVDQEKMTYPWYCEQKRKQEPTLDVPFMLYNGTTHPISEFVEANYDHHKIYVTGPRDPSLDKDYVMVGQGLLRVLIKLPASVNMNAVPPQLVKIEEKKAENDIIWKNFELKDAVVGRYEPKSFEGEIVTIYAKARFNQGWAYEYNRKYEWAIKEYEEAIKIDASFASPYKNLGILYLNALNRPDLTVKYWDEYLQKKNIFETDKEAFSLQQELEKIRKYTMQNPKGSLK